MSYPFSRQTAAPIDILLVSAFFEVSRSKHFSSEYIDWISYFLGNIETPIYFFTTPALAPKIRSLRGDRLPLIVNTSFSSPFDIPVVSEWTELYKDQTRFDPDNIARVFVDKHGPELYAVWNAKPYLLLEGVRNQEATRGANAPHFTHAFWVDAGSFRSPHLYRKWPSPQRIREIWKNSEPRVLTEVMWLPKSSYSKWTAVDGPFENLDAPMSAAGLFGGPVLENQWFADTWYDYHRFYLTTQRPCSNVHRYFAGKEQNVINTILLTHPDRFFITSKTIPMLELTPNDPQPKSCGDPWFYYTYALASDDERESMAEMWLNHPSLGAGNIHRSRCVPTKIELAETILRNYFGSAWQPPSSPGSNLSSSDNSSSNFFADDRLQFCTVIRSGLSKVFQGIGMGFVPLVIVSWLLLRAGVFTRLKRYFPKIKAEDGYELLPVHPAQAA